MSYLISPRALKDLNAIYDYIARDKPDAAAGTVDGLLRAIEQLEIHANLGHEGRRQGTRELVHKPFVIVYRIRKGRVEIAAVIHGSRKYE